MATISYVAKREMQKNGYLIVAVDISAAAADDSFNSSSTNLTGLPNDDWFTVSGFANAANNGQFQASANSTSTKIAQDSTTSLVTESAGPSITITGYKRGVGQSYSLEFYSERSDRSVQVKRNVQQPIGGGAPEVLVDRRETFVHVTVLGPSGVMLTDTTILQWREFLASVEAGETFTFDRFGTIAVPVEPVAAILENPDYQEEMLISTPSNLYKLSFEIRLLP